MTSRGSSDPTAEPPDVGPDYAGAADAGVVSSVGEHDAAAGDIVEVVLAEHRKIERVFAELTLLVEADDVDGLRLRWGGVVREILEHEAAERRVVLAAVEQGDGAGPARDVRRQQQELMDRLGRYDALNPDVSAEDVRTAMDATRAYLRTVDQVVVPLLERLPAEERMRLGEDLRQVKG
ncbi:MAG TPA: hemerythrin domain-containing protein [Mycobacteriales bacterium]|jgi:hemerythrin superfamily protein|nr:hemerythrin domain-containing protein [Mycobacteriales bacterium]